MAQMHANRPVACALVYGSHKLNAQPPAKLQGLRPAAGYSRPRSFCTFNKRFALPHSRRYNIMLVGPTLFLV